MRIIRQGGFVKEVDLVPKWMRRFGVSPGGPFDRESFSLCCAMSGANHALEVRGEITVEILETCLVASVGAGCYGESKVLARGQKTIFRGNHFYLSVGSGRPIELDTRPASWMSERLRVLAGPEMLMVAPHWTRATYSVSPQLSRVGVRIEGEPIEHDEHMISEPQTLGVVQLPPAGLPIILGPDGPTIGGYPRIGVVIDADIDRVSHLQPGQSVDFKLVTLDEAREAKSERSLYLSRYLSAIETNRLG